MQPPIRLARAEDAAGVLEIYAPIVRSSPTSFELEPPTCEVMAQRMRQTLTWHPWLVLESERPGSLAGYAYASVFRARPAYRWTTEVSVYVHEEARGRGVARALYAALFRVLARQGLRTVIGGISLPNPASVRLHESMGFRPVGRFEHVGYKFDAWHTVGFWSLDLVGDEGARAGLPEPRPIMEVSADEDWASLLSG